MIAVVLTLALSGTTIAAQSRCNDLEANALHDQMQEFAQNRQPDQVVDRLTAIAQAQTDAEQERTILKSICPDRDYGPLASRLYAIEGWGDLLHAQMGAAGAGSPCPQAAAKSIAATIASAWFKLATASTAATTPDKLVATLTPQVQAEATNVGLTLPSFSNANSYWYQQQAAAASQAAAACK